MNDLEFIQNVRRSYNTEIKPAFEEGRPTLPNDMLNLVLLLEIDGFERLHRYHSGDSLIAWAKVMDETIRGKKPITETQMQTLEMYLGQVEISVKTGNVYW